MEKTADTSGCTIGQYLDISLIKYMTVDGKRQEAKQNDLQDMSLEELNDEINAMRYGEKNE